MNPSPAIECGDALIVFEGARRIRGRNDLWPDAHEAEDVRDRIEAGRPILVVLGGPHAEAAVLTEQFAGAPPALAELVRAIARDLSPIPALDWLPSEARARGLRFLRASTLRVRRTPALLCPPLALDERDLACPHVRFAHLARETHEGDLTAIVAYAFADLAGLPR